MEWRIDGFEEIRELGRGGQGRVVLARHAASGGLVAVKYLLGNAGSGARTRFREEAVLLGRVRDPHVARLYRLVEGDQGLALVMEAVDGVPFREILARYGSLAPEAALTVLKGSLLGLAAAHAAGVVHRDYKPSNVIVPADGRSKLIDFGVATMAGAASASGTPAYMAPEQWLGEPAGPAADVYAATCVFVETVTGRRPFADDPRGGHLAGAIPVDEVPEALRPLIERGMAKAAASRPPGAAAFVRELEAVAQAAYGPDWESRGAHLLAGIAMALASLFPLAALSAGAGAGAGAAGAGAAGAGAGSAGAGAAGAGSAGAGTAGAGSAGAGSAGAGGASASASGVSGLLGGKAGVAIAATAIVATAGAGYGVYQAVKPAPKRHVAASAPPTKAMTVGRISLRAPVPWALHPIVMGTSTQTFRDSNLVAQAGGCAPTSPGHFSTYDLSHCKGYLVMGPSFFEHGDQYLADRFTPNTPFGGLFVEDKGMDCPADAKLRVSDAAHGARRTVSGFADVGSHRAQYFEWTVPCWTRRSTDERGFDKQTSTSYTERIWYLPDSKIIIVDFWRTPDLDKVLAKATWT
ncbi:serine/threonine-protein kinase [Actinomadura oligospora]|uniref:serine/threonine-protein kinase n=1 Tax=Actinomadura oligospora TaxID=111804 RepID=UPI0004B71BBF|nr:serine/threonine-protein kinase [Actinomadura oligospora]